MTLTKRNLVMRISSETGLAQQEIHKIIQKTLDHIARALATGDKVELRKFGVFGIAIRKPRVGRNPKQPQADVAIPLRAVVKFKASKELKLGVARLPAKKILAQQVAKRRTRKKAV